MRWADKFPRHAAGGFTSFQHRTGSEDCADLSPRTHAICGARFGHGIERWRAAAENGIVISLARMNRVLEIDLPNARVVVEPGVINLDVTGRVLAQEYFYAPDPSSQSVCTIGGNVAENSGGAHCLKYGFTTTHVLGLEVVLPDGALMHFGGKTLDTPGWPIWRAACLWARKARWELPRKNYFAHCEAAGVYSHFAGGVSQHQ